MSDKKTAKFLTSLAHREDPPFNGRPFDVVIPVMGPTGVGKSTFINHLLESIGNSQPGIKVGHGLESCTSQLNPIIIDFGRGANRFTNPYSDNKGRLVIVDTPGFDDTYVSDGEILRRVSVWLGISYAANMKLGGVVYLHDITQARMLGTIRQNLTMFQKLIGEDALRCVVLGTTKWSLLADLHVGHQRQEQLQTQFWKEMIEGQSYVVRVSNKDTPREIVNGILDRIKFKNSKLEFLTIQKELVKMRKFVPQTDAGQTLKYSLDELIKLQKRRVQNLTDEEFEKGRQDLDRLLKTAKDLQVPMGKRIMRFLGFY